MTLVRVRVRVICRPRKDERLSWPSWLPYSGRFTHSSGYPSAVDRAQDSESSPVKDQHSAAEPRNQPRVAAVSFSRTTRRAQYSVISYFSFRFIAAYK